jgi:uncharacterized membrane protein YdjX (TVP38/TMEM64 family)
VKNKKLWIFIGLVAVILVLNHIFGWSSYLGDTDNLAFLKNMIQDNLPGAIAIYMAVTIIGSVVLALPGVTFAILAGLIFGPVLGTVLCTVSATAGAVLAFLAGRFFLRDSIRPAAMKNKYLKKWLFDESGKNQLFVLMITRLVPLFPYNLQNFAYGVTDISFVTYTVGSFVFMIPGTAMYTIGTAGLADAENRMLYIGVALAIAVVVVFAGIILKKKYIQEEPDESE